MTEMNRRTFAKLSAAAITATTLPTQSQVVSGKMQPVLKRGYDNSNTGANNAETVFTIATVASRGIKQIFSLPMEGDRVGAEAQTLIAPSIACDDGTTRDLAIVCSMNGLVYAFDANDSDIVWVKKLSVPIDESLGNIDSWRINNHWSVVSTPVIDLTAQKLYAVAWTSATGAPATGYWQMHVLNLRDGSRVCAPVAVEGTSKGQTWNKMIRKQRSSLLQATLSGKKTVFFAASTMGETASGAAGWVFAFDCATNKFTACLATSSGNGAGIWMGGSSMVCDGSYLYAVTGNGGYDGVSSFGESALKIAYSGSALSIVDWFCPWTDAGRIGNGVTGHVSSLGDVGKPSGVDAVMQAQMTGALATNPYAGYWDEDLGSGGTMLVPGTKGLLVAGKTGVAYMVNTASMGKTMPADFANPAANYAKLLQYPQWYTFYPGTQYDAAPANPTALDFLVNGKTRHQHSCSVYYNSPTNGPTLFCGGENSSIRAWKVSSAGQLSYLAQGNETASPNVANGMTGSMMCISSNGGKAGTGLLWVLQPLNDANQSVSPGRLLVYDAENFANGLVRLLWNSQQWNINFMFSKFNPPVCSGGKLFVPTYSDRVDVYSLA